VVAHATRHSLVLLNESLSSTSPGEGLYLARDVVRALMLLGARAIFATHLHELAENLHALNAEMAGQGRGDTRAISLVAMTAKDGDGARRTYHIVPAPPMGLSFARDIASQYGISFEQLQRALAERNVITPGK
jgi:DNA mismatch repair protein MutS